MCDTFWAFGVSASFAIVTVRPGKIEETSVWIFVSISVSLSLGLAFVALRFFVPTSEKSVFPVQLAEDDLYVCRSQAIGERRIASKSLYSQECSFPSRGILCRSKRERG